MVTLTAEEARLVVGLCDLALKTDGLGVVNAVVPLAMKCQAVDAPADGPKPEKGKGGRPKGSKNKPAESAEASTEAAA